MFLFVPLSSPMFRLLKRNRIVLQSLKCYRCELVVRPKNFSTFNCQSNLPSVEKVAVLYSDQFQLHQPPNGTRHPECPGRVTTTMRHLESSPIFSSLQLLPFEDEPCDDTWLKKRILSIHSVGYLEDLERWINQGAKSLDADTYLCDKSLEVSRLAVRAWLKATQYSFEYSQPSFVLARPPGHHATPFTGMGFCIFSNLAIAAKYAMEELGVSRVSILDWDVHHGNGTASCFQRDERVRFVSLHQFPFYPMTGAPSERGPLGNLLNIAFEAGADGSEFVKRLEEEAIPFLSQHKPDIVFVSAGYDALKMDPLGGLCLVPDDYFEMTRIVMSSFGHERIVFGLEGGYHLEETAKAIEKTLHGILHRCI